MIIAGVSMVSAVAVMLSQPVLETSGDDFMTLDRIEDALPTLTVDRDDFEIDRSCIVRIPPGTVIHDDENDGVLQIIADDVTVIFDVGTELVGRDVVGEWWWGSVLDTLARTPQQQQGEWDTLTGTGITINGHKGVEIIKASIRGYRNGIVATDAPGLTITDATLTDLYRQRLGSTATREDTSDWLSPHHNDENQWLTTYGAAVWAERCHGAKFDGVKVRRGQNGIVLDNTNHAIVINNDCSFLSGWGLAMWRASGNLVRENRFDFCVRGHVEGVYNRGQDSAGILMFEACSNNRIELNSCTHSGDGIFGFGGNDAVKTVTEGPWGNANNRILDNDLSFAPAHGLEMTFSQGNIIRGNLFESNAICGFWGGYSQEMRIDHNRFVNNGGMAYGAERGGINIEHGSHNWMYLNDFINNRCGVRLWWDHDESLLAQPGVKSRYRGVQGNLIHNNLFVMDADHPFSGPPTDDPIMTGIEIQDIGDAPDYEGPRFGMNESQGDGWILTKIDRAEALRVDPELPFGQLRLPWHFRNGIQAAGSLREWKTDRASLHGRKWIVVGEWGAWDFETPLMRFFAKAGTKHIYEIYPPIGSELKPPAFAEDAATELIPPASDAGGEPWRLVITPEGDQPVSEYGGYVQLTPTGEPTMSGRHWVRRISGRFINTTWSVRCWAWDTDPLDDPAAWRAEADAVEPIELDSLDLLFANGGPAGVNPALAVSDRDKFAIIAETEIELPEGNWKLSTRSDDGVRVLVNGKPLIERWDIHGPTRDEAVLEVSDQTPTRIEVEYFENDGYAMLRVDLRAAE